MKISHIVVLIRSFEVDISTIKESIGIRKANQGSNLTVLYLIDGFLVSGQVDAGIFPDQAKADLINKGNAFLEDAVCNYGLGLEIQTVIKIGSAKKILEETVKETQIDLLLMSAEKKSFVKKLFEQDVVSFATAKLGIPVLLIPPAFT